MNPAIKQGPLFWDVAVQMKNGRWIRIQNNRALTAREVAEWVDLEAPAQPSEEELAARNHRADDYASSRAGAIAAARSGRGQRVRLLEQWVKAGDEGLIDEEAAIGAGLLLPGVCHWKRSGELRSLGHIEWDGSRRRKSTHGVLSRVSVVTESGLRAVSV